MFRPFLLCVALTLLAAVSAAARVKLPAIPHVVAGNRADRMLAVPIEASVRGKLKKHVDPTVGHRNHVHVGMTTAGALARTSFWRAHR